jgi:DNA-binding MarR family transcriptional regulator
MKRSEPTDYSADELARATRRLDMALADWHGELSERMEMGSAELMVLARLAMDDTIGPSELAHSLHVTTGAMTALLDRLAERGHVVREPHPSDRRRVVLRLTPEAHDAARTQLRPMIAEIGDLARRLSPGERRTVGRFLDDLTAIVQRDAGAPPSSSRASSQPSAPASSLPASSRAARRKDAP